MDRESMLEQVLATLDDGRLSRSERKATAATISDHLPSPSARKSFAQGLVSRIAERMSDPADRDAVEWLWDVVGLLWRETPGKRSQVYFGPGDPMVEVLEGLIRNATSSIDIAVFTITDNRLANALKDAHKRGVTIRVLSDDDKQHDRGSDVQHLEDFGIPVVYDGSPYHFHHKFAVVDGDTVVNGSYNWTRGAAEHNRENFLVSQDPDLVSAYVRGFAALWSELAS